MSLRPLFIPVRRCIQQAPVANALPQDSVAEGGKMKWKMGNRLVFGGFAIATAILVFVGWQSYQNTARFAEASEWRKHTYEVLRNLDETVARLVDAETGQRGYLLTGDDAYLEPYRAAIKSIDQTIGNLKNLTSDNPNQQKRIQILEPLVEKKVTELQRTINLRKNEGLAAANRVVLEGSGKHWMDEIRAVVVEMANEEEDLLKLRTQKANESVARVVRTILTGTLLSISLLMLCFGLLQRELSERKKAQEALAKSEKWFSTTLASIGDAVIATDMNGGVTFLNPVAQSKTLSRKSSVRGRSSAWPTIRFCSPRTAKSLTLKTARRPFSPTQGKGSGSCSFFGTSLKRSWRKRRLDGKKNSCN